MANNTNPFVVRVDSNYSVSPSDFIINVDSTNNSVNIQLPSLQSIIEFQAKQGYSSSSFQGYTINDIAGFASVNSIIITPHPDDAINSQIQSVIINQNYGGYKFSVSGGNVWGVSSFGLGGASNAKIFNGLISQLAQNSPTLIIFENSLGFTPDIKYQGVGVYATDIGVNAFVPAKTQVWIGKNNLAGANGTVDSIEYAGIHSVNGRLVFATKDGGIPKNDILSLTPIKILVYP